MHKTVPALAVLAAALGNAGPAMNLVDKQQADDALIPGAGRRPRRASTAKNRRSAYGSKLERRIARRGHVR